jgi:hypothetical protein
VQLQLGVIASHFERGRNFARAVQYYRSAADVCLGNFSQMEAIAHFTSAIKLLETDPRAAPKSAQCKNVCVNERERERDREADTERDR